MSTKEVKKVKGRINNKNKEKRATKNKKERGKNLTQTQWQLISRSIINSYLLQDQEDYCEKGFERCGRCIGCKMYRGLVKSYKLCIRLGGEKNVYGKRKKEKKEI